MLDGDKNAGKLLMITESCKARLKPYPGKKPFNHANEDDKSKPVTGDNLLQRCGLHHTPPFFPHPRPPGREGYEKIERFDI